MRKARDYNAELKALRDRQRELEARMVQALGELVKATKADALQGETLAGALLAAAGETDPEIREGWRRQGAAFFQQRGRKRVARTGGRGASQKNAGVAEKDARREEFGDAAGHDPATSAAHPAGHPAP